VAIIHSLLRFIGSKLPELGPRPRTSEAKAKEVMAMNTMLAGLDQRESNCNLFTMERDNASNARTVRPYNGRVKDNC